MNQVTSTERLTQTPPGVRLCALEDIPDRTARGFVLRMRERHFHGFVVRCGERAYGYVDRCPHAGLPLAQQLDRYLTPNGDFIACSWHGALFSIQDGACVGGPCTGRRLSEWRVEVVDGAIRTA